MHKYLFLIFFISANLFSHPGPRSKDGCHYCKKDCEKFNLTNNTRHSHNEKECDKNKGPIDSKKFIPSTKKITKYNRNKFKHWSDVDKDCQNTRAEILISRSIEAVTFKKSRNGKKCTVQSGKWNDYYFPDDVTSANEIDVDHVVPLKNAWDSGAHSWDGKLREEFANDPENLVLTNKKYNRQKGAQTPLTWAPANREYNCKYLKQWLYIKRKYKLRIDPKIYEFIEIAKCN